MTAAERTAMYRAEEWRDGWLWVKSSPNGNWWPANTNEVIRALAGKVQALEARLAERQTQPEPQKAFNDWGRVG